MRGAMHTFRRLKWLRENRLPRDANNEVLGKDRKAIW